MLLILTTLLSKYKCNPLLHQEQKNHSRGWVGEKNMDIIF